MTRDSRLPGITGAPPDAGDCGACASPRGPLDLTPAGHHPTLRGTRRLRDRSLGKLRVCRSCGRLWAEHYDSRECYVWHADLGIDGIDVLRSDTTPARVVIWTAGASTERGRWWIGDVLTAWLRREPGWAQAALDAILAVLAASPREADGEQAERAADRRLALVHLAGRVFAAARESDSLVRPSPESVRAACREYVPPSPDDGVYPGKNSSLMIQAARVRVVPLPAERRDAPLRVTNLDPLIDAAVGSALPDEACGAGRGHRLASGFGTMVRLRNDAGRWLEGAAPLAMPPAAWRALDQAVDPCPLLQRAVAAILDHRDAGPSTRRDVILALDALAPILEKQGARLGQVTLHSLEDLLTTLQRSDDPADAIALNALRSVVHRFRRARDGDCDDASGACSEWIRIVEAAGR